MLTFGRGETQKTVSVLIDSDLDFEPDETFFLNLSDAKGGITITDAQAVGTITNDDAPARPGGDAGVRERHDVEASVQGLLGGPGAGSGAFGYAVPAGAGQLAVLPWGNINQVSVQFNKDVLVLDLDLAVRGVNVAGYPVIDFAYEEVSHTATWTLGRAVRNDKLLLVLDGSPEGITDAAARCSTATGAMAARLPEREQLAGRRLQVPPEHGRGRLQPRAAGPTPSTGSTSARANAAARPASAAGPRATTSLRISTAAGGSTAMDLLHVRQESAECVAGRRTDRGVAAGAPFARGDYRRGLGMVL